MIVGQVGSGKSSLLSALLGEMITLSGAVEWSRSVFIAKMRSQMAVIVISLSLKLYDIMHKVIEKLLSGLECSCIMFCVVDIRIKYV